MPFEPLPEKFSFPQAEQRVLAFWQEHDVFAASLRQRAGCPRFEFYEGPPTANGMPHPGHCLTRAMKDLFPRYRTMCGRLCERKAGWDTHGLPVEVEVCKELGIHAKEEIEAYGVERFVRRCIESVWRYTREWEYMTERLGFWINLQEAYATYHQYYVESVWWSLKTLFERGLLYQGHKVVWWWCQGGTALSAGEVGEGYRTVDDPSVFVKFPLVSEPEAQARDRSDAAKRPSDEGPDGPQSGEPLELVERIMEEEEGGHGPGAPGAPVTSEREAQASAFGEEPQASARAAPGHQSNAVSADPRGLKSAAHPQARTSLLVWTTTPWTLISNHFAAVHPELEYALVHDPVDDEYLYIAKDLVETIAKKVKRELKVVSTCKGSELVGLRYLPPFDCYYSQLASRSAALKDGDVLPIGWRVLTACFVTLDAGTGLVHEAPAFGEVDFNLLQEERQRFVDLKAIPLLCAVNADGTFNSDAPPQYRGRLVFDCDKDIIRELRERTTPWENGTPLLYHQELYRHEYPFCPRAEEDKLIQYARKSWFVRTSQFKEEFLKNNAAIHWLPEHIKEGRFGDFLRNNVDWALSRERYWGTPLPIWQCEQCGRMEAIGSLAELTAKPGASDATEEHPEGFWAAKSREAAAAGQPAPEDLKVHKPYIDAWTYECAACGGSGIGEQGSEGTRGPRGQGTRGRMRRVPEVIDGWWDAGSMPFAQWGFPHREGSGETFAGRFPADFISEAIDQTRGWFYGLLAINTLLFGRAAQEGSPKQGGTGVPPVPSEPMPDGLGEEHAWVWGEPFHVDEKQRPPLQGSGSRDQGSGTAARPIPAPRSPIPALTRGYPLPYRACIVLGLIMGEDGNKMSKRLRNYREPSYIFEHYGADAMRWFFFSAQAPWTSVRFQEAAIRDIQREFLVKLYNVLSFFTIYANIDGFRLQSGDAHPTGWREPAERSELDRWILSELHRTIRFVRERMDRFESYPAAQQLIALVDALSNWYVRRSRERFWRPLQGSGSRDQGSGTAARPIPAPRSPIPATDQDKWDAYNTLYECLLSLAKLIAPFTPFFAEFMYQHLTGIRDQAAGIDEPAVRPASAPLPAPRSPIPLSVHLCDYPVADEALIDEALAAEMELVREIVSLGRAARTAAKLKVRQPLARVELVLARHEHEDWLRTHASLIAEELNVKQVDFAAAADQYVTYKVSPNFKAIGVKYRQLVPGIKRALGELRDAAAARRALVETGSLAITVNGQSVTLTPQEVEIRLEARPGWSAAQGRAGVVVISTELTPELREEGVMREVVHHVQAARKDASLPYEARIGLHVDGPPEFLAIIRKFADTIRSECLAERIEFSPPPSGEWQTVELEGWAVKLAVVRPS